MLARVLGGGGIAAAEAWIGFAGGIAAAVLSALVAIRQARQDARANQPRRRRGLLSDVARRSCSAVTTVTGKPSDSTR